MSGYRSRRRLQLCMIASLGGIAQPTTYAQCEFWRLSAASPSPDDGFGAAVAVTDQFVVVGAPNRRHSLDVRPGAAFVFRRTESGWEQEEVLTAADGSSIDGFGQAVAIYGDWLAVGAPGSSADNLRLVGSVRVYHREGNAWAPALALQEPDGVPGGMFGRSVSLGEDTLVVGAPFANRDNAEDAGAVYVFRRNDLEWDLATTLAASDAGPFDLFGSSVALDGAVIVVGARQADAPSAPSVGAAYVYRFGENGWAEEAKLMPFEEQPLGHFGYAVAVSGDNVVVGAPDADTFGLEDAGAVYLFQRTDSGWSDVVQISSLYPERYDAFGYSVAVRADRLLVGAPYESYAGGAYVGSVYSYRLQALSVDFEANLNVADIGGGEYMGWSVALGAKYAAYGLPYDEASGVPVAGRTFVCEMGVIANECETGRPLCGNGLALMMPLSALMLAGARASSIRSRTRLSPDVC